MSKLININDPGFKKVRPKDRIINIFFSVGASVVILGTLFKLLHFNGANIMLMIGMGTEAVIFLIGAFERPLKVYDWDKIFDFETGLPLREGPNPLTGTSGASESSGAIETSDLGGKTKKSDSKGDSAAAVSGGGGGGVIVAGGSGSGSAIDSEGVVIAGGGVGGGVIGGSGGGGGVNIGDADKLTESIQQLSKTSEMIGEFSSASSTSQKLNKNLETAAELTSKYLNSQEALIIAANKLQSTYDMIDAGMEGVERNTQIYATKIEDIHKTLASINSIYEIHLNNIHTQTENWNQQAQAFKDVTEDIREVASGMSKIKDVSVDALAETEKFKNSSKDLTDKIEELNKVYGNMLNALN